LPLKEFAIVCGERSETADVQGL
jgi:hypothetical protein